MSASAIDAAAASAIEALFGAGTYRQESDERFNRESVSTTNVAYQLVVVQVREDPTYDANRRNRIYEVTVRVKKYVATQADERTWRLGGLATGLESLLDRNFWRFAGLDLFIDDTNPEAEDTETIGRVLRTTVTLELGRTSSS